MRTQPLLPSLLLVAVACTEVPSKSDDPGGKDTGTQAGEDGEDGDDSSGEDDGGAGDGGGDDGDDTGTAPEPATGPLSARLLGRRSESAAPLRGVTVWLEGEAGETTPVETDIFGVFTTTESLPEGDHVVCADIGAPERVCATEPINGRGIAGSVGAVELELPEGALIGRALLADATPCAWRFDAFDVEGAAEVEAKVEGRAVPVTAVSADGSFVALASPGDVVELAATCGAAAATATASTDEATAVDLYFDNLPPRVYGIVPTKESGAVFRALAGDTLKLEAQVSDDGGDDSEPLRFHWLADGGALTAGRETSTWEMNELGVPQTARVLVDDGEGSFGVASVTVSPAVSDPYLVVRVVDEAGTPQEGLTVTVDGAELETDETGIVGVVGPSEVPPGTALTVTVSGRGFADTVVPLTHPEGDVVVPVIPCELHTFDPTLGATLVPSAHAGTMSVTVPAGIMLDERDTPVTEEVEACLALVSSEELLPVTLRATPGKDLEARMPAPAVSAWVDFRLSSDPAQRVLAKAGSVSVSLKEPAGVKWADDEVLVDWKMPAGDDRWDAGSGSPKRVGGTVTTTIEGPSWLTPAPEEDVGCVRIWADRLRMEGGPWMVRTVHSNASGSLVMSWLPLEQVPNMLRPLPPASTISVDVYDINPATLTGLPAWSATLNTGSILRTADIYGTHPGIPCGGDELVLPPDTPAPTGVSFLSRKLIGKGVDSNGNTLGPDVMANAYYATIDPTGAKSTFLGWLTENGGNSYGFGSAAWAGYQNDFDLGFWRAMRARTRTVPSGSASTPDQTEVAMVVSNFNDFYSMASYLRCLEGTSYTSQCLNRVGPHKTGGAIAVAMEYAADAPGLPPYTRFYVYAPNGQRLTKVDLDGRGEKHVPGVCMNCHGGSYGNRTQLRDHVAALGTWTSGDVGARFLPFALDSFVYDDMFLNFTGIPHVSHFHRADQEARLRTLNEMLLPTNLTAEARTLIHGWYGSTDETASTLPAVAQDSHWRPPGAGAVGWDDNPQVYDDVVRPYCRGCHLSFPGMTWGTSDQLESMGYMTQYDVCSSEEMPHALRTWEKMWRSDSPHAPGVLVDDMAGTGQWTATSCPY